MSLKTDHLKKFILALWLAASFSHCLITLTIWCCITRQPLTLFIIFHDLWRFCCHFYAFVPLKQLILGSIYLLLQTLFEKLEQVGVQHFSKITAGNTAKIWDRGRSCQIISLILRLLGRYQYVDVQRSKQNSNTIPGYLIIFWYFFLFQLHFVYWLISVHSK